MNVKDEYHELLFGVRRSIRYHNRRRSFFDSFNLTANAFSLILGSATVYGILQDQAQVIAMTSAALVSIFAAINLVIGSPTRARIHHDLSKRFISLEKKMSLCLDEDKEKLAEFRAERLDIEAEEPPALHVLNCICHNELARAMGYGEEHLAKIAFYQRWLAPIMDIREHTIKLG